MKKIATLAGEFSTQMELKAYSDQQFVLARRLQDRVRELESEVVHLKSLLETTAPLEAKLIKLDVSDEQTICEIQLSKLKQSAMERELTLEETKRFDLLTKNLYLAKGQLSSIPTNFSKTAMPDSALLALVERGEDDGS